MVDPETRAGPGSNQRFLHEVTKMRLFSKTQLHGLAVVMLLGSGMVAAHLLTRAA